MIPTVKTITDITEPVPPAEPTEPNTLNLNKPSLILLLEYGINQLVLKQPVKVLDVQIGKTTIITYQEKVAK